MKISGWLTVLLLLTIPPACKKSGGTAAPPPDDGNPPAVFSVSSFTVDGRYKGFTYFNVSSKPQVNIHFSAPVNTQEAGGNITWKTGSGGNIPFTISFSNGDSNLNLSPNNALSPISKSVLNLSTGLRSAQNSTLTSALSINLITAIDSADKFPRVSDSALLTLVEQQTFKYFYDFGHPVSGLARERNTSADVVTTGGSGFGIMAILAGIQRNFISRAEGFTRIQTIVDFLTDKAQRYHGAFPHWMNGVTGATVPFSTQDDGGDLVETAYMMQGLLCARQFFSSSDANEISLRNSINKLYDAVEWNWFRQNGQNVLYWHWSPDYNWAINMKISGWNEALIVYVLAASSNIDSNRIPKAVYDNGWAQNGAIRNGNTYYSVQLPLGPPMGGPLFFSHYSFLGINPNGLSDAYANYWTQNTAHTQINYNYCIADPLSYNGYSNLCWGLTASDDNISGYSAHSPTNDLGVISPTAAISSMPYMPAESMQALKFFYYTLGDKLWGDYGLKDAFNLTDPWFAGSYLAIDQGPEIVMIENYRSGLLWNLFMSCPEIRSGMKALGFQGPQLD
jgi:hypothetical protein